MKHVYFVTGNKEKLREVSALIPTVQGIDLDLPEIQEIDPQKVIAAKLLEARKHQNGTFLVEDTSLSLEGMRGLLGPLAKWFVKLNWHQWDLRSHQDIWCKGSGSNDHWLH